MLGILAVAATAGREVPLAASGGRSPVPTAPTSPTTAPSTGRPAPLPQVRPAADLPPEQARSLGTEVEVGTSPLRYRVLDAFDEPIYHCLFSVELENLTDRPVAVHVGFRTAGEPGAQWTGDEPETLDPGQRSELILGWDGLSPDELGISEEQCAGPVELTRLDVAPG